MTNFMKYLGYVPEKYINNILANLSKIAISTIKGVRIYSLIFLNPLKHKLGHFISHKIS